MGSLRCTTKNKQIQERFFFFSFFYSLNLKFEIFIYITFSFIVSYLGYISGIFGVSLILGQNGCYI